MKRMMPAFFLSAILLSGCYDDYYFEESETTAVSQIQTTAESAEEESTEDSTDEPILMGDTEPLPPDDAPEPEPQEKPPEPPDEPEPSEDTPEETTEEPTTEPETSTETTTTETTVTETTTSDETEPSEPEQAAETAISEPTAEPPAHTEPTTENAAETSTEPPTETEQTDYEKALMVYEYIRENGYGNCVQYSSQTYEKCQEIGLPCWYVWTDAGIYGHVANTVCVDGIWFIMDTQAECFLAFNYGFTEVVDKDMSHIGDAEMLSNCSYAELFGQ